MKDKRPYPQRLLVEPTNDCPRSCHMCPRHWMKDDIGYMEWDNWCKIMDQMQGNVRSLFVGWRGEPIMHPDYVAMVRYASLQVDRMEIATGSAVWKEEHLKTVKLFDVISISLHDQAVAETVRAIADRRGNHHRPQIQISVVDTETTIDLAKSLIANVDRVKIKERHTVGGVWGRSANPRDPNSRPCERLYREFVISWNGRSSRCCIVWDTFPLDAFKLGIAGVWNYPAWRHQREDGILDETCKTCDQYGAYTNGEVLE